MSHTAEGAQYSTWLRERPSPPVSPTGPVLPSLLYLLLQFLWELLKAKSGWQPGRRAQLSPPGWHQAYGPHEPQMPLTGRLASQSTIPELTGKAARGLPSPLGCGPGGLGQGGLGQGGWEGLLDVPHPRSRGHLQQWAHIWRQ